MAPYQTLTRKENTTDNNVQYQTTLDEASWRCAGQYNSAVLQPEDLLAASPAKPSEGQQTKGKPSKATLAEAKAGTEEQLSAGASTEDKSALAAPAAAAAAADVEDSTSDSGNGKISSDSDDSGSSSSSESGETSRLYDGIDTSVRLTK